MIHFLAHISKGLQHHSIYWAIEDARAAEWVLGQPLDYHHIHMNRDANCVMDNITRWALKTRATVTFCDG